MQVKAESLDRKLTLRLSGELDHHAARPLMQRIAQEIELALPLEVVLDFSGVTFMDSSGIAVVRGAQRNLLGAGQTFCVIRTPPSAMRIFKAAGIQKRVQFLPDLPTLHLEEEAPACAGK